MAHHINRAGGALLKKLISNDMRLLNQCYVASSEANVDRACVGDSILRENDVIEQSNL